MKITLLRLTDVSLAGAKSTYWFLSPYSSMKSNSRSTVRRAQATIKGSNFEKCFLCERKLINHTHHRKVCLYIMFFDELSLRVSRFQRATQWAGLHSVSAELAALFWKSYVTGNLMTGRVGHRQACQPACGAKRSKLARLICWDQWNSLGNWLFPFHMPLP